jgi:hypothetical protein
MPVGLTQLATVNTTLLALWVRVMTCKRLA